MVSVVKRWLHGFLRPKTREVWTVNGSVSVASVGSIIKINAKPSGSDLADLMKNGPS